MTQARGRRQMVAEYYDSFAERYEESRYSQDWQKALSRAAEEAFLSAAQGRGRPMKRVLDCGCGPGRLGRVFLPVAGMYVGLDVSERMLHRARSMYPGLAMVRGDVFSLPFRPVFDVVVSSQVLTHLHDYRGPLVAMKGVLAREGCIVLDFRNLLNLRNFAHVVRRMIRRIIRPGTRDPYEPGFTTRSQLERICRSLGMSIGYWEGLGGQGARYGSEKPWRARFAPTVAVRIDGPQSEGPAP